MEAMEKAAKDPRAPMLRSDVRGVTTTAMPEGQSKSIETSEAGHKYNRAKPLDASKKTLSSSLYRLDTILQFYMI
jgi:hypothetical protein